MTDDAFDIDVIVTRKPGAFDPPPVLFVCVLCEQPVKKPWNYDRFHFRGQPREREPVCGSCARNYGGKSSGPVFNRQNYHTLRQLKAAINCLTWEVLNGKYRHR